MYTVCNCSETVFNKKEEIKNNIILKDILCFKWCMDVDVQIIGVKGVKKNK